MRFRLFAALSELISFGSKRRRVRDRISFGSANMAISRTKLITTNNPVPPTWSAHQQYALLEFVSALLDGAYTRSEILRWAEQVARRPPLSRDADQPTKALGN
jgi:hypothetical protein